MLGKEKGRKNIKHLADRSQSQRRFDVKELKKNGGGSCNYVRNTTATKGAERADLSSTSRPNGYTVKRPPKAAAKVKLTVQKR